MYSKIFDLAKTIESDSQLIEHRNQYTIVLNSKNKIISLLNTMKSNTIMEFDMLLDITAIDGAKKEKRFEVIYFLYSNKGKIRIRIKVPVEESNCVLPTAEHVYASANGYEREVGDMYGIKFTGHSDMRRFYMPEDFYNQKTGDTYHPLRKDFPLTGIPDSLPLPPFPERTGAEVKF